VPSRRFGASLTINNIKPKVCTYSCTYCHVGQTIRMCTERQAFHGADAVCRAVRGHVEETRRTGERIDHLTFAADGEPTLDVGLGRAVHVLRSMGIPVAVVTNGALLTHPEVRHALAEADRVSLKVDAVREGAWRRINRPHRRLDLGAILDAMRDFASSYQGTLLTETTLLDGVNDDEEELCATAAFVGDLEPATAYLVVPAGRTAEPSVRPSSEAVLARASELFRARHPRVELLVGHHGAAPAPLVPFSRPKDRPIVARTRQRSS
jgi:wyosine [tRNA(Phe)-imidazoG37] synthetase (radical SAM superfamily)